MAREKSDTFPHLDNLPSVQNDDEVSVHDSGQPVRYDQHRATFRRRLQRRLYHLLACRVQRTETGIIIKSRFLKNQNKKTTTITIRHLVVEAILDLKIIVYCKSNLSTNQVMNMCGTCETKKCNSPFCSGSHLGHPVTQYDIFHTV